MKKTIYGFSVITMIFVIAACQPTQNMDSSPVTAGAVMNEEGEAEWKLMMATGEEGDIMLNMIEAFNNMDAEAVFANSADTVMMYAADGMTVPMTSEAMSGWFATMDSVKWDITAIIPVTREESDRVSVIVDGMQTDYYSDGTVDSYKLMERFVFENGKMTTVYQYTAMMPEQSMD